MKRVDLRRAPAGVQRALVIIALAGQLNCRFAVEHPAVTAGTVAGSLALGACELASSEHAKCFAISGLGGLGIGLLAAFALWVGYEDAPPDAQGLPGQQPISVDPTNLAPAPVFVPTTLDAGVPDAPPPDAGVDAPASSAP